MCVFVCVCACVVRVFMCKKVQPNQSVPRHASPELNFNLWGPRRGRDDPGCNVSLWVSSLLWKQTDTWHSGFLLMHVDWDTDTRAKTHTDMDTETHNQKHLFINTHAEVRTGHKQFNRHIKALSVTHKTGVQVTLVYYYPHTHKRFSL